MDAKTFFNAVTDSKIDFLQEFIDIINELNINYCVIGGLAVNNYTDPYVSRDIEIVIVANKIEKLVTVLKKRFRVKELIKSINVTTPLSALIIDIKTDKRYQAFLNGTQLGHVVGYDLMVASIEDVLQGKVWAWENPKHKYSEKVQDWTYIARIIEKYSHLMPKLPKDMQYTLIEAFK